MSPLSRVGRGKGNEKAYCIYLYHGASKNKKANEGPDEKGSKEANHFRSFYWGVLFLLLRIVFHIDPFLLLPNGHVQFR